MNLVYVLIHVHSNGSSFQVCGATQEFRDAALWYRANDENDVFVCDLIKSPAHYMNSIKGWREEERVPEELEVLEDEQQQKEQ